jgi:methyl-accepting chemotaxis protein
MTQVDQVTQRTASAAEELASTAEEMSAQAEALQQLVAIFRVGDDRGYTASAALPQQVKPSSPKAVHRPRGEYISLPTAIPHSFAGNGRTNGKHEKAAVAGDDDASFSRF